MARRNTTYCGLLKQPDNQKATNLHKLPQSGTLLSSLIKWFLNTIRFGFPEKVTRAFLALCVHKFPAHLSPKL